MATTCKECDTERDHSDPYRRPIVLCLLHNPFTERELAKFWARVRVDDGCWEWTGTKADNRYGKFKIRGRTMGAHRLSLMIARGYISADLVVDHICRNRSCVNPAHLRVVTKSQNSLENSVSVTAVNKLKTYCPRGHEYTPENTRRHNGKRHCKACRPLIDRQRYAEGKTAFQKRRAGKARYER